MRKRTILRAAVVLTFIACGPRLVEAQQLVKIDYRKLVSRGDMGYEGGESKGRPLNRGPAVETS